MIASIFNTRLSLGEVLHHPSPKRLHISQAETNHNVFPGSEDVNTILYTCYTYYVRRSKHGTDSMVISLGGIALQGSLSPHTGNHTFLTATAAEYYISTYHLLILAHIILLLPYCYHIIRIRTMSELRSQPSKPRKPPRHRADSRPLQ